MSAVPLDDDGAVIPFTRKHLRMLQEQDDAIYGEWVETHASAKRKPGIIEDVRWIRNVLRVYAGIMAFTVLHDLGVPTETIGKWIFGALGIIK